MINKQKEVLCQKKCRYFHAGIVDIVIVLIPIMMALVHDYFLLNTILHQLQAISGDL